ncbi:hypothetical protein ACLB2K_055718 [Fragaria x ananassa]
MVEKTGELDPTEIVAMDLDAITTTQRDEEAKARQEKAAKKRTKSASPDIDLVEERPSKVCRTRRPSIAQLVPVPARESSAAAVIKESIQVDSCSLVVCRIGRRKGISFIAALNDMLHKEPIAGLEVKQAALAQAVQEAEDKA